MALKYVTSARTLLMHRRSLDSFKRADGARTSSTEYVNSLVRLQAVSNEQTKLATSSTGALPYTPSEEQYIKNQKQHANATVKMAWKLGFRV